MKLFDQNSKEVRENKHRLRILKKLIPGFLDRVVQRLQAAMLENENFEEQMYAEDEYLKALIRRDNQISQMNQMLKDTERDLEEEKKRSLEKDEALKQLQMELAKSMKENGISLEEIQ